MCISTRRAAPPPPPPPPPPPAPMLDQTIPVLADPKKGKNQKNKNDQRGNKDYRYTPDSGGHVGGSVPAATSNNPHRN